MRKPLALNVTHLIARNKDLFGDAVMTLPDTPPPSPPSSDPGTPPATPAPRTFTQDEVNRMMAAEKDQGRRQGATEAMQRLGAADEAEAQRIISASKEAERAAMTEAQRAQADAQTAATAAAADREAAAQERHLARLERALGGANAIQPTPTAALLHSVPRDADDATVTAAVEQLRTTMPGLFTAAGAPGSPPPASAPGTPPAAAPAGDPGAPPAPPAATRAADGAFGAKGREEAARRFPPKTA